MSGVPRRAESDLSPEGKGKAHTESLSLQLAFARILLIQYASSMNILTGSGGPGYVPFLNVSESATRMSSTRPFELMSGSYEYQS